MSNKFYSYWFRGFEAALEKVENNAADTMLQECGKACSESYTKAVYISEYNASDSLDDFLQRLRGRFNEMHIDRISDKIIEISYTFCACDLVKEGYISNPRFCRCSLHSLQTNWDAVTGKGNTKISLLNSILAGDDVCRFQIEIL